MNQGISRPQKIGEVHWELGRPCAKAGRASSRKFRRRLSSDCPFDAAHQRLFDFLLQNELD